MRLSLFACVGIFAGLLSAATQEEVLKLQNDIYTDYLNRVSVGIKAKEFSDQFIERNKILDTFLDEFEKQSDTMMAAKKLKEFVKQYGEMFNKQFTEVEKKIAEQKISDVAKDRNTETQRALLIYNIAQTKDQFCKNQKMMSQQICSFPSYDSVAYLLDKENMKSDSKYKAIYEKFKPVADSTINALEGFVKELVAQQKFLKDNKLVEKQSSLSDEQLDAVYLLQHLGDQSSNPLEILKYQDEALKILNYRVDTLSKETDSNSMQELQIAKKIRDNLLNLIKDNTALETVKKELESNTALTQRAKEELASVLKKSREKRLAQFSQDNQKPQNINSVAKSLSKIASSNQVVQDAVQSFKVQELDSFISNLNDSLQNSAKELNNIANTEVLKYSTTVATDNRLAKLSNPNNENQKLASLIKEFENKPLAGEMSSVISAYTDRFDYANNAWVNILSAYAKLQNKGSQNLYGLNFGFDKAFDDYILGSYLGYANSKFKNKLSQNKSDNIILGIYLRKFLENDLQLDARFYGSTIKNKLSRSFDGVKSILNQNAKFDSYSIATALELGKVFSFKNDQLFIKPLLGLEYKFLRNDGFKEKGDVPVELSQVSFKSLSAKLGSEFKYYLGNNFIFLTPSIEKDLSSTGDKVANVRFVGSTESFALILDENKKKTYFSLSAGGDLALSNNLSLNLTLGTKLSKENKFYNANLGLKYKY